MAPLAQFGQVTRRPATKPKEAGIEFKDVEVTDAQKAELKALTGKTSVPQVFVKGQFIGGCNDGGLGGTVPLLKSGKLQEMLK